MTSSPAHLVGANVRAELARKGKSQTALALHLGISQQSVSRKLSGRTPLTVDELVAVATYLGVPVGALLGAQPTAA